MTMDTLSYMPELAGEFEQGRIQIFASFELKMRQWAVVPWKLAGLGHHDTAKARQCATEVLDSPHSVAALRGDGDVHRLTALFLGEGQVREQLIAFSNGADLWDLEALVKEVAKLRLIPVVERGIESKHSITHRKGALRKPSPAYLSLQLRMPMWENDLKRKAETLGETSESYRRLHKARRLVEDLGIQKHPRISPLLSDRRVKTSSLLKAASAVMYSNDEEGKYSDLKQAATRNKRFHEK